MQDQLWLGQQGQLFSYKPSVKDGSVWRVTLLPGTTLLHINRALDKTQRQDSRFSFQKVLKRQDVSTLFETEPSPTFPLVLPEHAYVVWLLQGSSSLHSIFSPRALGYLEQFSNCALVAFPFLLFFLFQIVLPFPVASTEKRKIINFNHFDADLDHLKGRENILSFLLTSLPINKNL